MSADGRGGARRVVCLTEETTETLYALGAEDRIVGISGFTPRCQNLRPPRRVCLALTSGRRRARRFVRPLLPFRVCEAPQSVRGSSHPEDSTMKDGMRFVDCDICSTTPSMTLCSLGSAVARTILNS